MKTRAHAIVTRRLVLCFLWIQFCLGMGACATEGRGPSHSPEVRTTFGDTTEVRTSGIGAWGDSLSLVEDLVIGSLDGDSEYQFGLVTDIAVDASGGVYVFDTQVPALRYFDASGTFVRQLGNEGQGPGEYRNGSLGLVVRHGDGRVVMRDPRNQRLNVYHADGTPSESWAVASSLYTDRALLLDKSDHMYLMIVTGRPEPNRPWPFAYLHMDDRGEVVDTLVPPSLPGEPDVLPKGYHPQKVWAVGEDGGILVAVSDRYVLHHYRADGTVLRVIRDIPRPRFLPEEKAEIEALNEWRRRTNSRVSPFATGPLPDVKPLLKNIFVGDDGRIWVPRYATAEKVARAEKPTTQGTDTPPSRTWQEPNVYDAFEANGTFLGTMRAPIRTQLWSFRGDRVWGVRFGEFNEQYVVRYRIERH